MLLNKFPKDITEEQKKQTQQSIPSTINGVKTDLHKYLQALQKNTMKDNMFVTQVSSVEELAERAKSTQQYITQV